MNKLRQIALLAAALLSGLSAFGQRLPDTTVNWETEVVTAADGTSRIVFTGTPVVPLDEIHGTLQWISCVGENCHSPEELEYDLHPTASAEDSSDPQAGLTAPPSNAGPIPLHPRADMASGSDISSAYNSTAPLQSRGKSIWGLILEAILWGLAMLLTPCVFPMVPMTVSFFVKGSENAAAGKFRALMYGLFIVLLYTVPISIIIGLTWIFGGSTVTADIFNWLATHWLPNIIFFVVFMLFAASFFGAFEITLPSKLVNSSDKKSDKAGLAGVFFMALTLVLVSFSCTGPIVGTVLIKSTSGEFWTPMVTMLAFSIAFALPFTLLALFPSLLKSLPKSGGWLNSVKVVLGFIEVALGFKFLSVADQTYHWGILDREVYLAIWIVCFTMLGFYLLGKLRFKYDDEVKHIGITRLALAITVFSFVVYMIPGMFGAPLKALSGYLPPLETQDFVIGNYRNDTSENSVISMPHGLVGYDSIEAGMQAAKGSGKRVFVDITGHGCVNCREMEARVWSDPQVLQKLSEDFEIVALYTDDKLKLPESKWITTPEGKVLKDVGRVNSYIARTRFGVNAQPNYIILDANGNILAGPRGYDLSIPGFLEFLK
jgi:thiol:disulfide interchange protein DsbD